MLDFIFLIQQTLGGIQGDDHAAILCQSVQILDEGFAHILSKFGNLLQHAGQVELAALPVLVGGVECLECFIRCRDDVSQCGYHALAGVVGRVVKIDQVVGDQEVFSVPISFRAAPLKHSLEQIGFAKASSPRDVEHVSS